MNREEIKEILPHREPMLLVDEIVMNEDGTCTGKYTVKGDEYFLQGHFPGYPVVPGVILCEMASQSSCLIMADKIKGKLTFFIGMNNVKFKNQVTVGDTVEFTCEFLRNKLNIYFMKAEGRVNGKLAMSGEFSFALIDKPQE